LTQFIDLLGDNKQDGWFSARPGEGRTAKEQQPYCRTSSVIVLMGVVFGRHDHQNLRHLTSFCREFLEVWGSFKIRVDCCGCPEQQRATGWENGRQNKYFLLSALNKF
jgi:hypothetical protein